eukprot:681403-Rhodomonas_salina.3
MQSDGSDWGYEPEPATPTYDYFPQTNYPGSAAYNYPGYPVTNAAAKEVCIALAEAQGWDLAAVVCVWLQHVWSSGIGKGAGWLEQGTRVEEKHFGWPGCVMCRSGHCLTGCVAVLFVLLVGARPTSRATEREWCTKTGAWGQTTSRLMSSTLGPVRCGEARQDGRVDNTANLAGWSGEDHVREGMMGGLGVDVRASSSPSS